MLFPADRYRLAARCPTLTLCCPRLRYANFATAFATRYPQPVTAGKILLELVNEPNNPSSRVYRRDASVYARLVAATATAVKVASPMAEVVGPASENIDFAWLTEIFELGVLRHFTQVTVCGNLKIFGSLSPFPLVSLHRARALSLLSLSLSLLSLCLCLSCFSLSLSLVSLISLYLSLLFLSLISLSRSSLSLSLSLFLIALFLLVYGTLGIVLDRLALLGPAPPSGQRGGASHAWTSHVGVRMLLFFHTTNRIVRTVT